ncbi:hypothetical protein [Mycobacterium sp.]|uniref:hypothetical protein n=1 Tax=Mycobacterium sp. TaxID=1785 RepID=UPI003C75E4A9
MLARVGRPVQWYDPMRRHAGCRSVAQRRAFVFCTGPTEQKFRNLEHDPAVALTTGTSRWQDGLDLVEGLEGG